jgi:hypothetical protein
MSVTNDFFYRYIINKEENFCYLKFFGNVRGKNYIDAVEKIKSDPLWDKNLNQIIDLKSVKEFSITEEELFIVTGISNIEEKKDSNKKIAFVLTNEIFRSMFFHYFENLKTKKGDIKIFRKVEEAINWLNSEND